MRNMCIGRAVLTTIVVALALVGCSATGTTVAPVSSASGAPSGTARFSYYTRGAASARLVALLPGGERFEGEAISRNVHTDPGVGFVTGRHVRDTRVVIPTSSKTWTGDIDAVLTNAEGEIMECSLRERRAGLGLEGGAVGTCTVSDGRRLAARF